MSAEVAIAEDFKRLLAALSQEKRKELGSEFAFVFEAPENSAKPASGKRKAGQERSDKEKEEINRLREEVNVQEDRIEHLRQQISELERAAEEKAVAADAAALEAELGRAESPVEEEAPPPRFASIMTKMVPHAKEDPLSGLDDGDSRDKVALKLLAEAAAQQRIEEEVEEEDPEEEDRDPADATTDSAGVGAGAENSMSEGAAPPEADPD